MSEPDVFDRTYAAARVLVRRIYADGCTEDDFDRLAAEARSLACMLDRCALAAAEIETAQDKADAA